MRGTCRVGFVALLGSSGPKPSSPDKSLKAHDRECNKRHTIRRILAPRNGHGAAVIVGRDRPMCYAPTPCKVDLATPVGVIFSIRECVMKQPKLT
jgi:hypothetical protein